MGRCIAVVVAVAVHVLVKAIIGTGKFGGVNDKGLGIGYDRITTALAFSDYHGIMNFLLHLYLFAFHFDFSAFVAFYNLACLLAFSTILCFSFCFFFGIARIFDVRPSFFLLYLPTTRSGILRSFDCSSGALNFKTNPAPSSHPILFGGVCRR